MKKRIVLAIVPLLLLVMAFVGCGGATGTLEFYANGEDFVRQGFVSMDGWSIQFDHVYITLTDIEAYQTDPPFDPTTDVVIKSTARANLGGPFTIDLAEGGADADPLLVGTVSDAAVGRYNAISWKMAKATSGAANGYSLVMIGTAEKDGETIDFTINVEEVCTYDCGDYVGDVRKGILEEDGTADLEMTFHFDHIFGDGDLPLDDELNAAAVGFDPFAQGGTGQSVIIMAEMHLGHVGEGHCHCECQE
jgi:hypothetical protein